MPTIFDLVEAEIDFASGSESNWGTFALPIPQDMLVLTTDTWKFRRGTGVLHFSQLPDSATVAGVQAGETNTTNVLVALSPSDSDKIIYIANELYKPSSTTVGSLTSRLAAIGSTDTIENANMDAITSQFGMASTSIVTGDTGKLVQISNHQMAPGIAPNTLIATQQAVPINITSVGVYTNAACTIPATSLYHDSTYYVKINASHDTADMDVLSFGLTGTNAYMTITAVGRGIFKLVITQPPINYTVVLTATATYSADTATATKSVSLVTYNPIIECLYGGSLNENFGSIVIDSSGNIICAGYTASEGSGNSDALVVKLDSNFNILSRVRYGGANDEIFQSVAIDSLGNIICAGYTTTEGVSGYPHCLVVKFDSGLNILYKKVYGGTVYDYFFDIAVDTSNNIICVGYTQSESVAGGNPVYQDALVVKFDSTLTILSRKIYGGNSIHDGFYGVTCTSSGNIVCVGYSGTDSGGNGGYGLVIVFDTSLGILYKKVYGGTGNNWFQAVALDSLGNIICVGYTTGEGQGLQDGFVIKFDSTLNIISRKVYGGSIGNELLFGVVCDASNNIICVGYTYSEGYGSPTYKDALIVKFDSSLNILSRKICGGTGNETFYGVVCDSSGNIYCSGFTASVSGNNDGLVVKFPSAIPSGTFIGAVLTGLIITDSTLRLSNSNLTLSVAGYTSANSALTLTVSALTLAASTLAKTTDIISV